MHGMTGMGPVDQMIAEIEDRLTGWIRTASKVSRI